MTRRWRFTLVATVIAVLGATPILSSVSASATPLSSKVVAAQVEPVQPGAGLAAYWNHAGTQARVFYVGTNNQLYNWYGNGTTWTNSVLGVGEAAAVGTGLTAFWNPADTQANVFYVGANGQLYTWIWDGKSWANKVLGDGKGEPAALGTGLAAYWNPDKKEANVFYVGANGQLYNWYGNDTTWANAELGDGKGQPAALGTGLAAYWNPDKKEANVFYVGANRKLYNWYWGSGVGWANAVLGGGTGEPAAVARNLAAFWHPNGTQANVFYEGINGEIYTWAWDGKWTNSALGTGEAAGLGRGLTAFWYPNGTQANVFYMGADGQIFKWDLTGTKWTNSALGKGVAAGQGTGLAAFWNPKGTQANVFYMADKGEPYNAPLYKWDLTGGGWTNSEF
jgi:hypothetical protein